MVKQRRVNDTLEIYALHNNPPIGIILAHEKDEMVVRYALHGMSSQLFVSKYQFYLPNEEELRTKLAYLLQQPE